MSSSWNKARTLTRKQVIEARKMYMDGCSISHIARHFGLADQSIYRMLIGVTYSNVPGAVKMRDTSSAMSALGECEVVFARYLRATSRISFKAIGRLLFVERSAAMRAAKGEGAYYKSITPTLEQIEEWYGRGLLSDILKSEDRFFVTNKLKEIQAEEEARLSSLSQESADSAAESTTEEPETATEEQDNAENSRAELIDNRATSGTVSDSTSSPRGWDRRKPYFQRIRESFNSLRSRRKV